MSIVSLGTTALKLVDHNDRRKLLTFTNDHVSAKVYLSDEPNPSASNAKWLLLPKETLIFDGNGDFPDRAIFGISDTASTTLVIGYQNEGEFFVAEK